MLETLETRRFLSATITSVSNVLKIVGDGGNDAVTGQLVGKTDFSLTINGNTTTYTLANVKRIQFDGGAGSDSIVLGNVALPLLAAGGAGADTLSGGDAADSLFGMGGEDYVFGSGGADQLDGGIQGDTLFGGTGDDFVAGFSDTATRDLLSGGDGVDTVTFAQKTDGPVSIPVGDVDPSNPAIADYVLGDFETLIGTGGDDNITTITGGSLVVFGGAGNDRITLGSGNDRLIGGLGADTLVGGPGNDFFDIADGGADQLFGGSGNDSALGSTGDDTLNSVTAVV